VKRETHSHLCAYDLPLNCLQILNISIRMSTLKLSLLKENRRVRLNDENPLTYSSLVSLVSETFKDVIQGNLPFGLHWLDEEGDKITITNDADLHECVTTYKELNKSPIKVFVDLNDTLPVETKETSSWTCRNFFFNTC
jgi:hypothetical protein